MAVATIGSLTGGLLFGGGWLLWVDACAVASAQYGESPHGTYWIPGVLASLGHIMLNLITWEAVSESDTLLEGGGACLAKAWVFVAFCLSFGGILGSIWILVQESRSPSMAEASVAVATKLLFQTALVFFSGLIFRLSRTKSDA